MYFIPFIYYTNLKKTFLLLSSFMSFCCWRHVGWDKARQAVSTVVLFVVVVVAADAIAALVAGLGFVSVVFIVDILAVVMFMIM
jgi:hypothetical protein